MIENGHVGDLAGPYAVGACSPGEAITVAQHVRSCPSCAAEINSLSRTAEWMGVTAARRPDPGLRSRVLAAALAARPARPGPADAYRTQVAELDRLLTDLQPDQWSRAAHPHPTIESLMLHLAANDKLVAAAAGTSIADELVTAAPGTELRREAPDVRRRWRAQADAVLDAVGGRDTALLDRPVRLAGRRDVRRPLREALIQRGFETWIHAEDVRAVLDLPPRPPDGRQVGDIVGFALKLLPAAMRAAGHDRTVRLVLTGDGGRIDLVGPGVAVAEVVLPAERFCRLLAGRLTATASGAEVTGDPLAANGLLTVAATMGCD